MTKLENLIASEAAEKKEIGIGKISFEQAKKIIQNSLAVISEKLNLNINYSNGLSDLNFNVLSDAVIEQFSEILYALKSISQLLENAVAKNVALEVKGVVIEPHEAAMLEQSLRVELFRLQVALEALGVAGDAQLLKGSSRPPGNTGGTNPLQIGLGMSIGSIDTILTQGNLQATGQITGLAIEGRAYFVYSNGEGRFYSRNGALQMDAQGHMVCPTNGYILQGMLADVDGTYPAGTPIGNIRIPHGEKAPANATTEVVFASNLDSDSEGLGTVLHTNRFLHVGEADDFLIELFDENGNDLGIRAGDTLTFSCVDGNNVGAGTIT